MIRAKKSISEIAAALKYQKRNLAQGKDFKQKFPSGKSWMFNFCKSQHIRNLAWTEKYFLPQIKYAIEEQMVK